MTDKEPTIMVKEANALLAELVTVLEQAIEVHGTHDLETIASLCCLPYDLLLRLLRVLGSEQTTTKVADVPFAVGMRPMRKSGGSNAVEKPSQSIVLTEQEQQLLHLWREAADSGSDQLSVVQDLALLILKRKIDATLN